MAKIDGIYVALRADYTKFKQDLSVAQAAVKSASTDISNSLNNALSPAQISRSTGALVRDLANIEKGVRASAASFNTAGITAKQLGVDLGISSKAFGELQTRMLKNQAAENAAKALADIGRQAGLSQKELRALGAELGVSKAAMDKLGAGSGGIVSKIAGMGVAWAGAMGAMALTSGIKDVTMLAARYETLGVAMKVVGGNAGYTAAQMDGYAGALQKTGISAIESRSNITKMAQAQLDLGKSTELARVAQDAAVIGNMNSSEAFAHMVQGIQSAQVEMLRTIGINVSFEAAYQKTARATGRMTSDLSESEKAQIRMNAVLEAGKGIAGTYEAAMGTTGKQVSSLARYHEDLGVEIGNVFSPAAKAGVEAYSAAIKALLDMMRKNSSPEAEAGRQRTQIQNQIAIFEGNARSMAAAGHAAEAEMYRQKARMLKIQDGSLADTGALAQIKDAWLSGDAERKSADIRGAADLEKKLKEQNDAEEEAIKEYLASQESLEKSSAAALKRIRAEMSDLFGSEQEKRAAAWSQQYADFIDAGISPDNASLKRLDELQQLRIKHTLSPDQITGLSSIKDGWQMRDDGAKDAAKRAEKFYEEDLKLQTEFAEKHRAVVLDETAFKLAQIEDQAKAYTRAGAESVAVEQWAAAERLKVSRDWTDGARRGLMEYADTAKDASKGVERAVTGAFKSMEDALVSFAMTGKMSFTDFANSVITDMVRMSVQKSMTGPLATAASGALGSLLSGLFGGGITAPAGNPASTYWSGMIDPSKHHSGGIAGSGPSYGLVDASIFANARRYHSGGLAGDEVPAILRRGEGVFTREQMAALGGPGTAPVVNIVVQDQSGSIQSGRQTGARWDGEQWVLGVMLKAARTNRGFRQGFGMGGM